MRPPCLLLRGAVPKVDVDSVFTVGVGQARKSGVAGLLNLIFFGEHTTMDIDFHYYATFAAARAAGYSSDDAVTIAHAAQYVDDSSMERLVVNGFNYAITQVLDSAVKFNITAFTPVPTLHTLPELGQMEAKPTWSTNDRGKIRRVWSVFHFLPANYAGSGVDCIEYDGKKMWVSPHAVYAYGDDDASDFKLLCLPNSRLLESLVNDTRQKPDSDKGKLHLTGIRMHVLADTWAHCYYAGTPNYWINDAGKDVYKLDKGERSEVSWGASGGKQETSSIATVFVNSTFYLGHGRMGHLPDYPWIKYEYNPKWARSSLTKDNPTDYLKGFSQMVAALQCIRLGKEFQAATTWHVPDEIKQKIGAIIDLTAGITDEKQRCRIWLENLANLELNGIKTGVPPVYDADLWQKEAHGNYDNANSNYYLFNLSARMHHDHVIENLKKHTDIDLNRGNDGFIDWFKELANNSPGSKAISIIVGFGRFIGSKMGWI